MRIETDAKQVIVYVNSTDQWHGRPMYSAIVKLCQDMGIAGASVTRCAEGFGSHHRLHTSRLLELSENLPVRIDIVDVAERIGPLLTALEGMVGEGLVIVQNVHILQFLPDAKN